MAHFTKYTLLELSDPALAHQVVTDITEDLFCGPAVESIYVEFIRLGRLEADGFYTGLCEFLELMSLCNKGSDVATLLWEALGDRSILEGIAAAVSNHVRALAASRDAAAADAEVGYLISFKEDVGEHTEGSTSNTPRGHASTKQTAPRFTLDSATSQALIDRKTFEGLTQHVYNLIICHKGYATFPSELLDQVLRAYSSRLRAAVGVKVYRPGEKEYLSNGYVGGWTDRLTSAPPHLVSFTNHDPQTHSGVWSAIKSKFGEDRIRPGYCRVQWTCYPLTSPLDIPIDEVATLKAAIATAPKVPYLTSRWANSSVPLFVRWRWPERYPKVRRFDHER